MNVPFFFPFEGEAPHALLEPLGDVEDRRRGRSQSRTEP